MDSESDLIALPMYSDSSKISNENDEFDTSFINNNTSSVRRVSFLRSPTAPGNLNTSNTSRGVSLIRYNMKNSVYLNGIQWNCCYYRFM